MFNTRTLLKTLCATLFVAYPFVLNPRTYAISPDVSDRINNFDVTIQIDSDGTIDISEVIEYEALIPRHGIYRNIPYKKTNDNGDKFIMTIDRIQVGQPCTPGIECQNTNFTESIENGFIKLKIGDPDITFTGIRTYQINYRVKGALTYFDDHDELFWNAIGDQWDTNIYNATVDVFYPETSETDISTVCYTGISGSKASDCNHTLTQEGYAHFETNKPLGRNTNGFTVGVGFPKGLVAVLEPDKDHSWIGELLLILVLTILFLFWEIFLPLRIFLNWYKEHKNVQNKQKIVAAWFEPPSDHRKKHFSPAETGLLHDKIFNNKFLTATIIHLAQCGFMKIRVKDKNDIKFEKTKEFIQDTSLSKYERKLLEGIFTDTKFVVDLKDLKKNSEFAAKVTEFTKYLYIDLDKEQLFIKPIKKVVDVNTALVMAGLFLFNFQLAAVAWFAGRKSNKRTDLGIEKYSEAASLKNFLVSQDEQLDFQAQNQMFFEKLLPYATAFGVEDVWIKRFGDLVFKNSDWYEGNLTSATAYNSLTHSLNSGIVSAATYSSGTSSSGFSSGFSGSGSSGGGGGGGGGGGW